MVGAEPVQTAATPSARPRPACPAGAGRAVPSRHAGLWGQLPGSQYASSGGGTDRTRSGEHLRPDGRRAVDALTAAAPRNQGSGQARRQACTARERRRLAHPAWRFRDRGNATALWQRVKGRLGGAQPLMSQRAASSGCRRAAMPTGRGPGGVQPLGPALRGGRALTRPTVRSGSGGDPLRAGNACA